MPSQEFENMFERASLAIIARHGRQSVEVILKDIRERASTSSITDPTKNRRLFLDAEKSSQMISVKQKDYQTVIEELHKLQLVHVWKRAICPNTEETIVETDDPEKLLAKTKKVCLGCGKQHLDLADDYIDTIYAINFSLASKPLGLIEFLAIPNAPPINKPRGLLTWISSAFSLFQKRNDTPIEQAANELGRNRSAKLAPAPSTVFLYLSIGSLIYALVSLVFVGTLFWFGFNAFGAVAGSILALIYFFLAYFAWAKLLNSYVVPKLILTISQPFGWLLTSIGSFGIGFRVDWEGFVLSEWYRAKIRPGFVSTEKVEPWLICAGVVVVLFGCLFSVIAFIAELYCGDKKLGA